MADLTNVTENFFATASETYTDNLSASISAEEETVPVNSANEYTDGDVVVLTVEPGTTNEATFTGVKASSPDRFTNCVWTEGNLGVGHASGSTIIDYDSATHFSMLSKGVQKVINQDGTLKQQPVRDALGLQDSASAGWEVSPYTYQVTTGYNKGNREFDITVANNDLSGELSPGMRMKFTRETTPLAKSMYFDGSASAYLNRDAGSVTGITFGDDFTIEATYLFPGSKSTSGVILNRRTGTNNGFMLYVDNYGKVKLKAGNGSDFDEIAMIGSLPEGKWVHIAVTMNMSANTGTIYLDGVAVASEYTSSAAISISHAGNLRIGNVSETDTLPIQGNLRDVRLWSVIRSETEIRDNMYQFLEGTEANLVGYWKLIENTNDSTTNANHLTVSGTVPYQDVAPYDSTVYAIVTKVVYGSPNTTITVITPSGSGVPNMALSEPFYSTQKVPFGFPISKDVWEVLFTVEQATTKVVGSVTTYYNIGDLKIRVPSGAWELGFELHGGQSNTTAGIQAYRIGLSRVIATPSDMDLIGGIIERTSSTSLSIALISRTKNIVQTDTTDWYLVISAEAGSGTISIHVVQGYGINVVKAVSAYL